MRRYLRSRSTPALAASLAVLAGAPQAQAGHGEAPGTAQDPAADMVDFYLFRSPENLNTITMVATVWPHLEPASGPQFPAFADDVRYNVKIDSNGDAREDVVYEFRFTTQYTVGDQTYLYARGIRNLQDQDWLIRQTYQVTHVDVETNTRTVVVANGVVAPPNIGRITPGYTALANSAIQDITVPDPGGGAGRVFAGPRDDPFFADVGALHDGFFFRGGQPGATGGVDHKSGWNVLALVVQVPITSVTLNRNQPSTGQRPEAIVGAWATADRRRVTLRGGGSPRHHGPWEQVSRAGVPLINTVVTPVSLKDAYNARPPHEDAASGVFTMELIAPDVADELSLVYPVDYLSPPAPRRDLVGVLGGNLHLGQPASEANLLMVAADVLRLDVTRPSSTLDGSSNRLGLLAGEAGFPNGRRLDDDVVDIMLRLISGWYLGAPFNTGLNGGIGDGTNANDRPFTNAFPYLAAPNAASAPGLHAVPN
jgi:hypothetical protein